MTGVAFFVKSPSNTLPSLEVTVDGEKRVPNAISSVMEMFEENGVKKIRMEWKMLNCDPQLKPSCEVAPENVWKECLPIMKTCTFDQCQTFTTRQNHQCWLHETLFEQQNQ